jgi:hypothetical protein
MNKVVEEILEVGFLSKIGSNNWNINQKMFLGQDMVSFQLFTNGIDTDLLSHIKMSSPKHSFFYSCSEDPDFSEGVAKEFMLHKSRKKEGIGDAFICTFEITQNSFYEFPLTKEIFKREATPDAYWEVQKSGQIKRVFFEPYPEKLLSLRISPDRIRLFRSIPLVQGADLAFIGQINDTDNS